MDQRWKPCTSLTLPEGRPDWWASHAQLPTPILLDEKIRVYVMARDQCNQSRVGWIDLCSKDPRIVLGSSQKPALSLGDTGCFDDMGVAPSCVVREQDRLYLYYVGITARKSVSLDYFIGLAISYDNGNTFDRIYKGPIIGKSIDEPYLCTSPYVLRDQDSWSMMYTSGVGWTPINEKHEMVYNIKIRRSDDGHNWNAPEILLEQTDSLEAIGRPWLDQNNILYFCSRGSMDYRDGSDSYRILAASKENNKWQRISEESLDLSSLNQSTKLTMSAYPSIIPVNDDEYLFYNGEAFGKKGLEIAKRSFL